LRKKQQRKKLLRKKSKLTLPALKAVIKSPSLFMIEGLLF